MIIYEWNRWIYLYNFFFINSTFTSYSAPTMTFHNIGSEIL